MNKFLTFVFSLAILAGFGTQSFAMDSMHGSMMTMPKCAAGDQVVDVNMKTKMYMMHDKMHMGMGMKKNRMRNDMMMHNMKMMCKSKADSMGAKMMKGSMMKKNSM